jgi:hypothetical protein
VVSFIIRPQPCVRALIERVHLRTSLISTSARLVNRSLRRVAHAGPVRYPFDHLEMLAHYLQIVAVGCDVREEFNVLQRFPPIDHLMMPQLRPARRAPYILEDRLARIRESELISLIKQASLSQIFKRIAEL